MTSAASATTPTTTPPTRRRLDAYQMTMLQRIQAHLQQRLDRVLASMRTMASVKQIRAYPSNLSFHDLRAGITGGGEPCHHISKEPLCLLYILRGLTRGLTVGYLSKTMFSLAISVLTRKFFSNPLSVLRQVFLSRDTARFSVFLGTMQFVYRALQCTFCRLRGRPGYRNSALAAFIAGAAILMDDPQRRSTISMYLLCRSAYEISRTMVAEGKAVQWDMLPLYLFCVCQVPIVIGFMWAPWALSKSYERFVRKMSHWPRDVVTYMYGPGVLFNPCNPVVHTGPCWRYNILDWLHGTFVRAPPIYIPVHFVPALFFKWRHVADHPVAFVIEASIATLRSCLFLASYTGIAKALCCTFRNSFQNNQPWQMVILSLSTGLSLLWEHPRRHIELLLYVAPRAIEITLNYYKKALPMWFQASMDNGYFDTLCFMAAMAGFVHSAATDPPMKSINASMFRYVFGPGTVMVRKRQQPGDKGGDGGGHGDDGDGDLDDAVKTTTGLTAAIESTKENGDEDVLLRTMVPDNMMETE